MPYCPYKVNKRNFILAAVVGLGFLGYVGSSSPQTSSPEVKGTTNSVVETIFSIPSPTLIPTTVPTLAPTNTPIPFPIATPTPKKIYVPPTNAPVPVQNSGSTDGNSYSGGDKDCPDFSTHAEAQAFFITNGGPASDPHRLDADHDGSACENLP